MKIGSRDVGPGHPVFIVAEIGSTHGGSLDAALTLIDAAADAGADAAKFQAGHADHVYDPAQFPKEHVDFKKHVEPVLEWLSQIAQRCAERHIEFGCSTFCLDALDQVDPLVRWHKVASIEVTWGPFLRAIVEKRKPVFASEGALDGHWSIDADARSGFMPLHCVVSYPADLADCHLRSHPDGWNGWGLSDHTIDPTIVPCAAVALGASVVEKHLRGFASSTSTPDALHSIDPQQFGDMVKAIRLTEKALGSSQKRIRESERPYLKYRRGPLGLRGA